MATVIITGGTGMIGTALTSYLAGMHHEVIIFTRDAAKKHHSRKNVHFADWDPESQRIDGEAIKKADYIIHLAGANVGDKRWTRKRKKEIIDSRLLSGQLLVKALKEIPNKVKAVLSSSAIGYYGSDPVVPNPRPFVEEDGPAQDFLSSVVQNWEAAINPVRELGKRLVIFRTGPVLSRESGFYREFRKPMMFGLATILGRGDQMVSWVHLEDLVRLYAMAMEDETYQGVYNVVTPFPVSNKTIISEMARLRGKPCFKFHVPAFLLKILFGEMSVEVLKSTTVSSKKLERKEFIFFFPTIQMAIQRLESS